VNGQLREVRVRTRASRQGDQGFTLLEVITTCLLLSILISLAVGPWQGYRHARAHREARDELVATLRNAQVSAVSENVTYRVDISADKAITYRVPVTGAPVERRRYAIDDDSITFTGADFVNASGVSGSSVFFYPRGSAGKGDVNVSRSGRTKIYTVSVEGLTARVAFTQ
jgi:prepilin-type N-terminal cleavage/methylation domain-containing protein